MYVVVHVSRETFVCRDSMGCQYYYCDTVELYFETRTAQVVIRKCACVCVGTWPERDIGHRLHRVHRTVLL